MTSDNAHDEAAGEPMRRGRGIVERWLMALGILALILLVIGALLFAVSRTLTPAARAASCANDVFYLHRALEQYAADHDGLFPPISAMRGNLMMDAEGFYPEYLDNSCWVQCEYSPVRQGTTKDEQDLGVFGFNDDSFCYLPWEIHTAQDARAFLKGYAELDLAQRDGPLSVELDGETVVLPRVTTASSTPVLVEWPYHAHPKSIICFTDGRRTLTDVGEILVTEAWFIKGLYEIASLDKPVPEWLVSCRGGRAVPFAEE